MSDTPLSLVASIKELDEAPAWLLRAIETASTGPTTTEPLSVQQLKGTPAWPLLLDAALVTGFLPKELSPSVEAEAREGLEAQITAFAELAPSTEGHRWTLTPQARRDALADALGDPELPRAIDRVSERFSHDLVAAEVRNLVTGTPPAEPLSLPGLEARRTALGLLRGTPGLQLPSPTALDNEIELGRLLARFHRMVGGDKGDRFFGRERDIERLRNYVGLIGPALTAGSISQRGFESAARLVTGRKALSVHGAGGAGKTTLLAFFMLEHAHAAANAFPFAYLDFDRSTISSRFPAQLLAEICVQVAAQFPELAGELSGIREQALRSELRVELTREKLDSGQLDKLCFRFRQVMDRHFDQRQGFLGRQQPFLLVFDTFELVQANPGGVKELETFVRHFLSEGFGNPGLSAWPRLRLVIAGRRPADLFFGKTEGWTVDALDRRGSIELLIALSRDSGLALTPALAARLVDAVAAQVPGRERGVRPLRLHLVAQALGAHTGKDPRAAVEALIEELKQEGSNAQQHLVDGLLVRRILGHVGDPRVRDLSDPGLVVRYVDPEIIREVIAPVTPAPGSARGPYPLKPGEEHEIFQAFRRQVSLIEDHETYVRHLQDVRREMLPLIRASRPQLFEELHQRAFDYFLVRAENGDPRAAGEAIYHGLWADAPMEELERLWSARPRPDARLDPDEFALRPSASAYLRARTGQPLLVRELKGLPPAIRLDWLEGQMPTYLRSRRCEDVLHWVDAACAHVPEIRERVGLAAGVTEIYHRVGRWRDAFDLAESTLVDQGTEGAEQGAVANGRSLGMLARVAARIWAQTQRTGRPEFPLEDVLNDVSDLNARVEIRLNLLLSDGLRPHDLWPQGALGRDLQAGRSSLDLRNRRLALLVAPELCEGLLPSYIAGLDALPRDAGLFGELVAWLADHGPPERLHRAEDLFRNNPVAAFDALDEVFRANRLAIVEGAGAARPEARPYGAILLFGHSDWMGVLAAALEIAFDQGDAKLRSELAELLPSGVARQVDRLSGRRMLAAINQCGGVLPMCRRLGEHGEAKDGFRALCGHLARWHALLQETASRNAGLTEGGRHI